ncbi:hypothetical protein FAVG1_12867 [Fusarium avenaceum]|nr:hypothetical protein FAVG1_12867 [Fusarium avenaceum]
MTSYFERVVNESTYNQNARGSEPLDELNNVSSSAWDDRHLIACHVIIGSRNTKLLPRLKQTPGDDLEDDMRNQIDKFVNGLDEERQDQLENELVHDPEVGTSLAQIWDALYNLDASESGQTSTESLEKRSCQDNSGEDTDSPRYPKRSRTAVKKPGFVDPGNVFSSSPPRPSQDVLPSSQTEGYVESMSSKGVVLEDYTVRLVFCILRHILYHCQKPDSSYVEVRERQRAVVSINGREVTAIDDGGLCLTSTGRNKTRKSIVLIEAKRRLEVSHDRVVVSDSVLGQMLCEAIAASASGQEKCDDVFIINATSYYMCFFHFEISDTQLKEITRGERPVNPIRVNATRWLNVKDAPQRQHIARNIEQLAGYVKQVSLM